MTKDDHVCQFCNYDLDQIPVSFMHMSNAYLNCVATFKYCRSYNVGGAAETNSTTM